MADLPKIRPVEIIVLDAARLSPDAMRPGRRLGAADVCAAVHRRLRHATEAWCDADFARLGRTATSLAALAERAGLESVRAIACDLSDASEGGDPVATAAILARLVRVGEATLSAVEAAGHLRL